MTKNEKTIKTYCVQQKGTGSSRPPVIEIQADEMEHIGPTADQHYEFKLQGEVVGNIFGSVAAWWVKQDVAEEGAGVEIVEVSFAPGRYRILDNIMLTTEQISGFCQFRFDGELMNSDDDPVQKRFLFDLSFDVARQLALDLEKADIPDAE